ncbi:hypothetical protein GW819_00695 [Candidatus Gracilibacteria bacterium]|nr:hypothetical protein [Candidatus Gracilibacteria bacterium]OIO76401.1 MAG: hypothetical protein AUJ87_02995 [Candidatus Gracilibacteria bacterium CG1_02_38_174]PIQ11099.1 MAG: hypothetical protein COW68_03290 [Candidatus Gracilibacteria bacterium CG18_big_fil_WC_8_21_14_2_50_38_16]PIQ41377.1 MAG: hypothetical protein COW06_03160 [Candidatus Gracilibacteria bacterium CG12_big_fil_rev_8_21_14_0_65_38_15]PIZ01451.1 MAG: hypothetical protein COY60_03455 [Candidatus Gracilibacteria bacterium CG_4
MSIKQMSNNMTHARFLALTPSYEEIYQVLSIKLQEEYTILAERIKNMPRSYEGAGDNSIDGPLLDADQVTWDRYTEISTIGRTLLEEQ